MNISREYMYISPYVKSAFMHYHYYNDDQVAINGLAMIAQISYNMTLSHAGPVTAR